MPRIPLRTVRRVALPAAAALGLAALLGGCVAYPAYPGYGYYGPGYAYGYGPGYVAIGGGWGGGWHGGGWYGGGWHGGGDWHR